MTQHLDPLPRVNVPREERMRARAHQQGAVGNGYEPLNRILDSGIAVSGVVVLMIAKIMATSGSVASGIPGGIFTPMLLVGAALGAGWSNLASFGPVSDAGSYAFVGMASATAASSTHRSPQLSWFSSCPETT